MASKRQKSKREKMEHSGNRRCKFKGCNRKQYDSKTTPMYLESEGESWPDDVKQRPICFRHWLFQVAMEEGPPVVIPALMAIAIGLWWSPLWGAALISFVVLSECYNKLIKGEWRRR